MCRMGRAGGRGRGGSVSGWGQGAAVQGGDMGRGGRGWLSPAAALCQSRQALAQSTAQPAAPGRKLLVFVNLRD